MKADPDRSRKSRLKKFDAQLIIVPKNLSLPSFDQDV